ncbi:hypothetical protein [Salegentibacter chungangensis]|uniref:Lipoprotein n=1 Tax=Salegentibacter chungangensis TaxID=1335724 RepID=A0ABW3NLA2_9FLAO
MKKVILAIAVLSLVACGGAKKPGIGEKYTVEQLTELNSEKIKEYYSDANIEEGKGMYEEGTVEKPYTKLYPDTPDELLITWKDENRTRIDDVRFSGNGKWKSDEGIKVGTSYETLNKLNEKEISFYGFGWDYSGAVMWNDGKLEKTNVQVFLAPENEAASKFYGDHLIEASPEEISELDLKVQTVMLINDN